MENLITKARDYAYKCHEETNHLYDGKPYKYHLQMVVACADRFIRLIPEEDRETVIAACYLHDVIEDCRQSYNDVLKATNEAVAEMIYALTNGKGRNRNERADDFYYRGLRKCKHAAFVKVCDRIANYKHSQKGSRMRDCYDKEMERFCRELYSENLSEMFNYLKSIRHQTPD